jgi:predicted AAA+ superfamily ATPase
LKILSIAKRFQGKLWAVITRDHALRTLEALVRRVPVVAIVGPRQVGKTTLARALARRFPGPTSVFDLEDRADLARLDEPTLALRSLRGLVVIDEIQRRPELFPALRVLADRPGRPARFLVLGSAAPRLLRQGSESLAGRITYFELGGFSLDEVGTRRLDALWLRGGLPRSLLAGSGGESSRWRRDFVRSFVERDAPALGIDLPPATLERFWAMLAHYHGQLWNASELGRAFGVADTTVRRYLDALAATFVVRQLKPWSENLKKRQVKASKIYLTDSGLLHTLLGIETATDLARHPKIGASWEGFALREVVHRLGARQEECFFWRTHAGAELDLLVVRGSRRVGFEFKRSDAPHLTPSMRHALEDLRLTRLDVVHAGDSTFPLGPRVRAVALERLLQDVAPLR